MTTIKKYSLRLKEEPESYQLDCRSITSPADVERFLREALELDRRPQETLVMLTLDVKRNITGIMEVSVGGLSEATVHPRDIFQRAILQNAAGIIIAHNHPSGVAEPSEHDITLTRKLIEAGKILGIDVLDHIIIGDNFVSMKAEDLM